MRAERSEITATLSSRYAIARQRYCMEGNKIFRHTTCIVLLALLLLGLSIARGIADPVDSVPKREDLQKSLILLQNDVQVLDNTPSAQRSKASNDELNTLRTTLAKINIDALALNDDLLVSSDPTSHDARVREKAQRFELQKELSVLESQTNGLILRQTLLHAREASTNASRALWGTIIVVVLALVLLAIAQEHKLHKSMKFLKSLVKDLVKDLDDVQSAKLARIENGQSGQRTHLGHIETEQKEQRERLGSIEECLKELLKQRHTEIEKMEELLEKLRSAIREAKDAFTKLLNDIENRLKDIPEQHRKELKEALQGVIKEKNAAIDTIFDELLEKVQNYVPGSGEEIPTKLESQNGNVPSQEPTSLPKSEQKAIPSHYSTDTLPQSGDSQVTEIATLRNEIATLKNEMAQQYTDLNGKFDRLIASLERAPQSVQSPNNAIDAEANDTDAQPAEPPAQQEAAPAAVSDSVARTDAPDNTNESASTKQTPAINSSTSATPNQTALKTQPPSNNWKDELPELVRKLGKAIERSGLNKYKSSLASVERIYSALHLRWNGFYSLAPKDWNQSNITELDYGLYATPVTPPDDTPDETRKLFEEAHRFIKLMQVARIQELKNRNIRRIVGTRGDTKVQANRLEADPRNTEYNPDPALSQTYYDIKPGNGGYEYYEEGKWLTIKMTKAILYSQLKPQTDASS